MSQYYFSTDGTTQQGPVAKEGLRAAGVGPETMVWREGWPDWMPAGKSPELSDLFAGPPTPPPAYSAPPVQPSVQPQVGHQPPVGPGGQKPLPWAEPHSGGTNGYAIASLICSICGLVGFCCCGGIVASILGVIFGHIAIGQIKRGQGSGMGIAQAGMIIGYIGIALTLLGVTIGVSQNGFKMINDPNFNFKMGK